MNVFDIAVGEKPPSDAYAEVQYWMLGLASNNQLEEPQSGDIALITSKNNNKRKSSRTTEHKTSDSTKTCSYCQKHGGNSVGHVWQDCRKLKREQQRKKEKASNQAPPPPYQQNSFNQQAQHALVAGGTDLSSQMDIDQSDGFLNSLNRVTEL